MLPFFVCGTAISLCGIYFYVWNTLWYLISILFHVWNVLWYYVLIFCACGMHSGILYYILPCVEHALVFCNNLFSACWTGYGILCWNVLLVECALVFFVPYFCVWNAPCFCVFLFYRCGMCSGIFCFISYPFSLQCALYNSYPSFLFSPYPLIWNYLWFMRSGIVELFVVSLRGQNPLW